MTMNGGVAEMDDKAHNFWDIVFKWISLLVVIAGAGWTLYTYRIDRAEDADKRQRERALDLDSRTEEIRAHTKDQNAFIFQRQASLYFEAAQSAATLATALDPASRHKQSISLKTLKDRGERFQQLYSSELVVVEDRRVEMAMVAFRHCLDDKGRDCTRPSVNQDAKLIDPQVIARLGKAGLLNLSLELAACMRSALQEDRGIDLGDLKYGDVERDARRISSVCPYD
jgi:hypothetical protein